MYKELLEYIVKSLVINSDVVQVEQTNTDAKLILRLKVAKEDMGRVIGKDGRIIRSIREVVGAYASKNHEKVAVEIEEIKQ